MADGPELEGARTGAGGEGEGARNTLADLGARVIGPLAQALGSGVRIEMLLALQRRPWFVAELSALTELAPSNMSYHLRVLRTSGLVRESRTGRTRFYSLAPGVRAVVEGGVLTLSVDGGRATVSVAVAVDRAGAMREVKPRRAAGVDRSPDAEKPGA